jgi:hypothetical protein
MWPSPVRGAGVYNMHDALDFLQRKCLSLCGGCCSVVCQPNVGDGKPDLYSKAHNFRMQDICGSHRAIWMEGRFAPRYLVAVECLDDTWWYVLWRHDPAGEW